MKSNALFLSALCLMIGLSSCTQLPPPSSAQVGPALGASGPSGSSAPAGDPQSQNDSSNQNSSNPSDKQATSASVVASNGGQFTVTLHGEDAKEIYDLMEVLAVEQGSKKVKTGRQFSCEVAEQNTQCVIQVKTPEGEAVELVTESELKKAPADKAQKKKDTLYINVADQDQPGRVRLVIVGDLLKPMYSAIKPKAAFDLAPAGDFGPGERKPAPVAEMCQTSTAKEPEKKLYAAYFQLNVIDGSIVENQIDRKTICQ